MNKERLFDKFKDMIDDRIQDLNKYGSDTPYECLIELSTVIWTTKELTEITEKEIEEYLVETTGNSINDIVNLEDKNYYYRF